MLPTSTGGANWEGGVLDPETGFLYIGTQTNPFILALSEGGDRSDMNYIQGFGRAQLAPGIPIVKPPWGRITAIDLSSGDHAWMIANGDTPSFVAERLELDPADIPRTGKISRAGLLVTKTLLFAGEGMAGAPILRAHDKMTGEILAVIELPNAQSGLPMTYLHEGRQYIVLSVGGGGQPAELVALALPQG
jgi:quinoprotein glucose dehydrogenase